MDETSPTTLVIANADGSWTTDTAPDPVRAIDETGAWAEIDTTLVAVDGGYAPRNALGDLMVTDGGDKTFASMDVEGRGLDWKWPDQLPTPIVDGNTATYEDVVDGGDLVVTATPAGFRQDIVLHQAPTDPVAFEVPLVTSGPKLTEANDGSLTVETKGGDDLLTASTPVMYDASVDASGTPDNVTVVDATVAKTSTGSVLTLSPDQGFLSDPTTQYPVTIDPTFTAYPTADTWFGGGNNNAIHPYDESIYAGTPDSGATKDRSLIQFATGSWAGQHIMSASLKLRNWDAKTCNGSAVRVAQVTSAWKAGTATWNNQPTVSTTAYADSSQAYGNGTSCQIADMTWNVLPIVTNWAADPTTNFGVRVAAVNETINSGYRAFRSANYSTAQTSRPRLIVTFNSFPGKPTLPQIAPVNAYAPPGGSSDLYTGYLRPSFRSTVSDADGGTVTTTFQVAASQGGAAVASCTSGAVASGGTASCGLVDPLTNGQGYWVRSQSSDGTDVGGWSDWAPFTVASGNPPTPVISCPGYADGSWAGSTPTADVSCTISAASSTPYGAGWIRYSVDGGAEQDVLIPKSSDPSVAKTTVSVSKLAGLHSIRAWGVSRAGYMSTTSAYMSFGYGSMGLRAPVADPLVVTTGTINVAADGSPVAGTPTVKLKWRPAGSGSDEFTGWAEATSAGVNLSVVSDATGVHVTGTWNTMKETTLPGTTTALDPNIPVTMDVQICATYSGVEKCSWADTKTQIVRVPHAFGGNFPVEDVVGGQVALWTGEFQTDASDISIPTGNGSLTLSRTHTSYPGEAASPATGVFGAGWVASLDGPEAGLTDYQLLDNSLLDGTLVALAGDGEVMVFSPPGGLTKRTTATLTPGVWKPKDDDTLMAGITATVTGTGASTKVVLTEMDNTTTSFSPSSATTGPTSTSPAELVPSEVDEPGPSGVSKYAYDTSRRVSLIRAELPAGRTEADCPMTAATFTNAGCKGLRFTYATSTTATASTPGDYTGLLKSVAYATNGANTTQVTFKYTVDGYLASATDALSNLTTSYTYQAPDSSGVPPRLASIIPPGLKPISYEYAGTDHRLARVKRERPSTDGGGIATLATVLYDVPVSGLSGLPDMTATLTKTWGQGYAPTYAAAVFGPDQPVTTLTPSSVPSGAWADASLTYTDKIGQVVNTAEYGAGDWQYTATIYDEFHNEVRGFGPGDIDAIRDGRIGAPDAGSTTVYNTTQTSGGVVVLPAGSVVVDSYDRARWVTLDSGARAWARTKTHTSYDQGAPNAGVSPDTGQAYALPTTVKSTVVNPATDANLDTLGESTTTYSDAVTGNTDAGWRMGLAGSVTTLMPGTGNDITTRTLYDTRGRVIEQRQPKSASGGDAGARQTSYYTGDNTGGAACGNKPDWDGALCQTKYAGQAGGSQDLVTTTITDYTSYLNPKTITEAANGATRTTTTTYRTDQKVASVAVTATGLTGSTAVPSTSFSYDTATGLPTVITPATGSPITTGYDTWGRARSYTPATGETTTTYYDAAGRVDHVTDPKGTTTYTYDGTDASGNSEHRGLVTGISVSGANRAFTIAGAYDADGNLTKQTLPGGITQKLGYDTAGQLTTQSYTGEVTIDGTAQQDRPWIGWSRTYDGAGRVRREWTPEGAILTAQTNGAAGSGYSRDYTYDRASRLTKVVDRTATDPGTGAVNPDNTTVLTPTTCETRDYSFDKNGNRTTLQRTPANPDGTCQTSGGTGAVTKTWSYDNADRLTTGYTYDQLGRQTTLPQTDTPQAQPTGATPGNITLAYYDTDAAKTITQNGQTTAFTLDATGRRLTQTDGPTGGTPTTTLARHYTDTSDNPGYTTIGTGWTERYAAGLTGGLAATITNGTIQLALADPTGSTPAQITLPTTGNATGIDTWQTTDEYGNATGAGPIGTTPTNTTGPTDGPGYGWQGTHERALTSAGITLMGARLYNPTTGAFTSTDPIYGGNDTTYAYPNDPMNNLDLDGRSVWSSLKSAGKSFWKKTGTAAKWLTDSKWGKRIHTACGLAWGTVGAACGVVYGAAYARQGKWGRVAGEVVSGVAGGLASHGVAKMLGSRKALYSGLLKERRARQLSINVKRSWTYRIRKNWATPYRSAHYLSSNIHGVAVGQFASNRWGTTKSGWGRNW